MSGMWPVIGLAGAMMGAFAALVTGGVVVVHVAYRWWLMIMCGMDWDDAGTLIHARARRRHGAHHADQPASWPQAGDNPAYRPGSRMADRLARVQADAQLPPVPMITRHTGKPPWEDETHIVPAVPDVSMSKTQTWLAPGGGLDQTVQMPVTRDRRD